MSRNKTAGRPRQDRALVTAAEWFAGGQRIRYDPESARVLTEEEADATPGALRVFERVAAAEQDLAADTVWLTLLPGFPDGLPRRPPDHQRAPRPPRRGDPRHRGPARRSHPGYRPPMR